jgi:Fe-Mn family superoxide dismutase
MAFSLPDLPYEKNALEPHMSRETLEYHHGKHHATYVANLNRLVAGTPFENATLEAIVLESKGGVYNNAAQIWNHTFFWNCLSPQGGGQPKGALFDAITRDFGSFDAFKTAFDDAAKTLFGSGWVFLSQDKDKKLKITQEGAAGNPMLQGLTPLMTCDVWEHAYYIDHRNARPAYLESFWKLINWNFASANFKA